jgi:anaerobic selenocysteine-containing dehydrogenase
VVVPVEGGPGYEHIPVVLAGPSAPGAQFTIHRSKVMYDDGVRLRNCPSLHRLGPGRVAHLNPADAPGLGLKEGMVVKVTTGHGEGAFSAVLDVGTPAGVVYVPMHQVGAPSLGTDPVVRVKVVN